MLEKALLLLLFPLAFVLGKIISKTSEEEITEVKPVILFINKILILIGSFIILNTFFSIITVLIICFMLLIYLMTNEQSPKEKIIIAIIASISTLYLMELVIILTLISSFLKGQTTFNIKEKIFSKHTVLQTTLFFIMISFKFIIIGFINFL